MLSDAAAYSNVVLYNPGCHLPKEVEAASENKQSNPELKAFSSNGRNGFWQYSFDQISGCLDVFRIET
jgi:hypothetical protein